MKNTIRPMRLVPTADPFEGELPPRSPHAMRPLYLINDCGGVIPWEGWLAKTKADAPVKIEAMVFADGMAVDAKGVFGPVTTDMRRGMIFRGGRPLDG